MPSGESIFIICITIWMQAHPISQPKSGSEVCTGFLAFQFISIGSPVGSGQHQLVSCRPSAAAGQFMIQSINHMANLFQSIIQIAYFNQSYR